MTAKETMEKAWSILNEFRRTQMRHEDPEFFVIHSETAHKLRQWCYSSVELNTAYWISPSQNSQSRLFGVKVIESLSINEDEILIGITPLQKLEV